MKTMVTPESGVASLPKPLLRGWLHQIALIVAIPAGIALIIAAPPGTLRLAMAVYATSLIGLFGASALYHRVNWSPAAKRRARSFDHTMIFLLIAGTHTAFGAIVMQGAWRLLLLAFVWTGALVGITLKLIKPEGFSRVESTLFIALGWLAVAALPQIIRGSEVVPLILIAAGGLMYTGGAVVLLRRRPDPSPRIFGYHEVWHALVVAAAVCHYIALTMLLD